jgi:hypothetical protein
LHEQAVPDSHVALLHVALLHVALLHPLLLATLAIAREPSVAYAARTLGCPEL